MAKKTDGWVEGKFIVKRADGRDAPGEKHHGCQYFVIDLDHDRASLPTLKKYMEACKEERPALSHDLAILIEVLESQWDAVEEVEQGHDEVKKEHWRLHYKFGLPVSTSNRCATCRHIDIHGESGKVGVCRKLDIVVENTRTSRCPGISEVTK